MSKKKVADPVSAPKDVIKAASSVESVAMTAQTPSKASNLSAWGPAPSLTAQDVIIPKILAMQGMSKLVTDGNAVMGEFRDSLSNVVLGDLKNPIEFIPFHIEKVYVVMEKENKPGNEKFAFHHQEPITARNEKQPFECLSERGAQQKWYRTTNVYALLPKDIKAGSVLPFVISFRSTSAMAGRKVNTIMYLENGGAGKVPAAQTLELSGIRRSNDKGTFIVMDIAKKRETTIEELEECFKWYKLVTSGHAQVDHSDLEKEAEASTPAAPESAEY